MRRYEYVFIIMLQRTQLLKGKFKTVTLQISIEKNIIAPRSKSLNTGEGTKTTGAAGSLAQPSSLFN